MGQDTLPLPARTHAALGRVLDWFWPRGAAWAYADAIARAPGDAELHFLRGQALGRAGRWTESSRSLAGATRRKPSSAEYQGALVVALDRAGRDRELVEALRRLADLRPGEGELQVLLGAVLRRSGRTAEALRTFRFAVRLGPLPANRRFVLGETILGPEGWRGALDAWNEARQIQASSGSLILRNAGRRSALNFHPGRPLDRVPRRPSPPPKPLRLAWLRVRGEGLREAVGRLLRGRWRGERQEDRVRALRRAWKKAHAGGGRRRVAVIAFLLLAPGARAAPPEEPAPRGETAAAREQARLCERKNLEEGAAACRAALALGIGPARQRPVRAILARHLVALERWEELAELLRENVGREPGNAEAWRRFGLTLLFALDEPVEAVSALEEAARIAPTDADIRVGLGLALHAVGRRDEAVASLDEALRIDPEALRGRPAARALLEAARRGDAWP